MNLKSGIFVLVAIFACSLTTESNAQIAGNGFGRQAASRVARFYVGRSIGFPANQVIRFASPRSAGAQLGGRQVFQAGNQRWGNQFGTGTGLQTGRFFRRW